MISLISGDTLQNDQKVLDPVCGSGRMLLSAAKRNRFAMFYGADLDVTCCKMALINMLLNSLTCEISHMNSLTNEFFTGYHVPITLVDGFYIPTYVEFTEAALSHIWLHPLKGNQDKPRFQTPFEWVRSVNPINEAQYSLF
jgi:tRNA G37 N-methylase Trm5